MADKKGVPARKLMRMGDKTAVAEGKNMIKDKSKGFAKGGMVGAGKSGKSKKGC